MNTYIVKKVLNNNVIIATNDVNKEDVILIGKGLGFNSKKGDTVINDNIEKTFIKGDAKVKQNYQKILNTINNKIIGLSEEIIYMCEETLNTKMNDAIHISLPDHINFAIKRIKKGLTIENPFLHELYALYPQEYKLAKKSVELINKTFNLTMPEDEVGFICLHFDAALGSSSIGNSLEYTKKIEKIMNLISNLLNKKLNKNSLDYARTVTHIKFTLERIIQNKPIKNYLLDSIKKQMSKEYSMALKVGLKIESLFSVKVPKDEIGYITLHIRRLSDNHM